MNDGKMLKSRYSSHDKYASTTELSQHPLLYRIRAELPIAESQGRKFRF